MQTLQLCFNFTLQANFNPFLVCMCFLKFQCIEPSWPPSNCNTNQTLLWQNQRRPREVLEGAQDCAQPVPPVPIHPAPLGLHTPDGAAAPPQEDPRVPHLQKHPRPPQDLLLLGWRGVGRLNRNVNTMQPLTFTASDCYAPPHNKKMPFFCLLIKRCFQSLI